MKFTGHIGTLGPAFMIVALLAMSPMASALTATVEVNESPYFLDHLSNYGGITVVRAYAPMPVFFEGFKSTPRDEIVEYLWDFGDGSDVDRGFNAAHVYETPGTYTATLTVTDGTGAQETDTIDIEVLPRDGVTYYVDSDIGSDTNDGLTPGTAWRTAMHAFLGMNEGRYGPGDAVLFNRGQTFEVEANLVLPGHAASSYGYMFGAYGTGAKPFFQNTGVNSGFIIKHLGVGLGHFAMVDLHFDLTSTVNSKTASLFSVIGDAENLLFLRIELENFSQAFLANGKWLDNTSGYFIVECEARDSSWVQLWGLVSRYALIDSVFDDSENHVAYLAYVDRGVIKGNTLSRPAFGRTALRVASRTDDFDFATNNVYIADNQFKGWIDPIVGGSAHADGTRYNWELINLAPNGPWDQRMHDVVFERNIVSNAETLLTISDYDNLVVRNNLFIGKSQAVSPRIKIGKPGYDKKPLRNIRIIGNTIVLQGTNVGHNPVFGINEYIDDPYEGITQHTDIQIKNNIVYVPFGRSRMLYFQTTNPELLTAIEADNNLYYAPNVDSGIMQIAGNFQGGGTNYFLPGWQALTGNDLNSLETDPLLLDIDGPDDDFAGDIFDENLAPREDSPVIDAAATHPDLAYDLNLIRRPIGGAPDIGAIEQATALSIIIDGQGTVDRTPGPPYQPDQDVTLTATAATNWVFTGWSGDLVSTNATEIVTLDSSKVITAHFTQVIFELDVSTFGQGSVGLSPPPPYSLNDVVTVTANPDVGQVFLGWSEDLTGTVNPETITMDSDKSILATFTKDEYFLNISTIGTGTVNATPPSPYSYNDAVSLNPVPGAGMLFYEWSGDFTGNTVPLNFNMTDDYDVTARFVQTSYSVTTSTTGSGTVVVSPIGTHSYLDPVTVTATPNAGWEFDGWTGTQTSNQPVLNFNIGADQNLTANFVPIMYDVNFFVIGSGSVELSPPGPYLPGTEITVTGVPDFGWQFNGWGGDVSGSINPQAVIVNNDMNVTASFIDFGAGLAVWSSEGGSVVQDPAPPYDQGSTVSLTAAPSPGYQFLGWAGDLSGTNPTADVILSSNKSVGAYFGRAQNQSAEVVVPFFLDSDGIVTATGAGVATQLSVHNGLTFPANLTATYSTDSGIDATPVNNTYQLFANNTIRWRPVAPQGFPTMNLPYYAGGVTVESDNPGLTGIVRTFLPGANSDHAAYLAPDGSSGNSLSVPFFLDDDGVTTAVDAGTRTFIGVRNSSNSDVTLTISYRGADGTNRTPAANTYVLGARQSISWRPVADDPDWEGAGSLVPNMTGGEIAGSAFISANGPLSGRQQATVLGVSGGASAYLLPDGGGAATLYAPFVLDDDGYFGDPDTGMRSFVGVQNLSNKTVTMVLQYVDDQGVDVTPPNNTFDLAAYQSASWRPFADEPALEGPGALVPNALNSNPVGAVRVTALGGRIAGRVVQVVNGTTGPQAAYTMPSSADSQTLVVPYFNDGAGQVGTLETGVTTFIGIMNVTPFDLPISVNYYRESGQDETPPVNTFVLPANSAISWRPAGDEPDFEGSGASVPNMISGARGSAIIYSPLGGIVGRAIQINGRSQFTQSSYQIPKQYDVPATP